MNDTSLIATTLASVSIAGSGLRRFTLFGGNKVNSTQVNAHVALEHLEATISATLDGIIIMDSEGNIVHLNESAERIFGHKRDAVLGQDMASIILPERQHHVYDTYLMQMRDTGKENVTGKRIEINALKANGQEFVSEFYISRRLMSGDEIFIAYIRDITESKATEQALIDARDAAELANKAKTQFISAMSHEIRTPFNAVLGILEILADTNLTKDQTQLVETVEKTSQSLLLIINDVLDYTRISSGSVKLATETFRAPDVFNDVYRLFRRQAKDRNIALIVDVSKAEDIYLSGDIGRIGQVLVNFVSNAIKYTRDGTVELIVETQRQPSGKLQPSGTDGRYNLICKVKDNGQGISEDKLDYLFDEFYMAGDVDARTTEGTGLGLTICKTLTTMMGGTIGVESKPRSGSTFWINIPLRQTQALSPRPKDVSTSIVNIDGKKILLAEDNVTNRMVVSRILEKHGAVLTLAINGTDALASLNTYEFDLLLTDVFMPEMGGKELVQKLRGGGALNANIPVIALTAMGDIHEAEELKSYGVDQVILKPFKSKNLIKAIADQCSDFEKRSELIGQNETSVEEQDFDLKMSGGLMEGLNADDIEAIKGQFEMDLKNVINTLRESLARKDIEATKFSSHTLKGLAGLYGLSYLSELAALTNSHCSIDSLEKMIEHGTRAVKVADVALSKFDDLFEENEVAM